MKKIEEVMVPPLVPMSWIYSIDWSIKMYFIKVEKHAHKNEDDIV